MNTPTNHDAVPQSSSPKQIDFATALQRLRDGNRRFVQDVRSIAALATTAQRAALASAQSPFAVILSCADSRVPSEMVFDQGLGSLFVVRVAGNIVAPSLVGSIEYAVDTFGVQLVVVMGHTSCGAVKATLDYLEHPAVGSKNVLDIVERIRPAVAPLVSSCSDHNALLSAATRANVRASASQLRSGSPLLKSQLEAGRLLVVGAEYSLETGVVDMFDGVPASLRA
ncbi:MAG TPA: carbonic anhydrase [Labilithrix sp.]|nr:carbonic anhydrase [Labilithrix sp.]